MTDDGVQRGILEAVEAGFDGQVAFLGDLVRMPSLRGAEAPAQDVMAEAYRARGYGVDRWKIELADIAHLEGYSPALVSYDNAWNVVASHRPRAKAGRSLILALFIAEWCGLEPVVKV